MCGSKCLCVFLECLSVYVREMCALFGECQVIHVYCICISLCIVCACIMSIFSVCVCVYAFISGVENSCERVAMCWCADYMFMCAQVQKTLCTHVCAYINVSVQNNTTQCEKPQNRNIIQHISKISHKKTKHSNTTSSDITHADRSIAI